MPNLTKQKTEICTLKSSDIYKNVIWHLFLIKLELEHVYTYQDVIKMLLDSTDNFLE